MKLEGKSIVVTGASAGIGRAIVELFAQEGANIIAVARRGDRLVELAAELASAPAASFRLQAISELKRPATE